MTRALLLLLALTGTAYSHEFWISKGQYVSPSDGVHCCGERDCFQIPAASIVSTSRGHIALRVPTYKVWVLVSFKAPTRGVPRAEHPQDHAHS